MVAEDHIRSALSNCGLRVPVFLQSTLGAGKTSKGMKELIKSVKTEFKDVDESQRLQNNEQLEFLGDAVLEYICR